MESSGAGGNSSAGVIRHSRCCGGSLPGVLAEVVGEEASLHRTMPQGEGPASRSGFDADGA
eukprot:9786299-Lingulodinium_polyedra.AAC.1